MAFVKRVCTAGGAIGGHTLTATTAATSGGGTLLVAVAFGNQAGTIASVTDTKSNTYIFDFRANTTTTSGRGLEFWRCTGFNPLTASDSITVATTSSVNQDHGIAFVVDQFSTYLAAPNVTSTSFTASATAASVSLTALSTDVEVWTALTANSGTSYNMSVASPLTESAGRANSSFTDPGLVLNSGYDDTPHGFISATWTWTRAAVSVGGIAAYPPATGATGKAVRGQAWQRRRTWRDRARLGRASLTSAGRERRLVPLAIPPATVTVAAGPVGFTGTVTIAQQVTATSTFDYGWSAVNVSTTAGNTLVVLAGWDLSVDSSDAAMAAAYVTDSAGNLWIHAGTTTSSVTGSRSCAWVCPNALPVMWVTVSATTFVSSLAWTLVEVAGMPAYASFDVQAVNASAAAGSLTLTGGATSRASIAFAVLAAGADSASVATPAGWIALDTVTAGAGAANPAQIFTYWAPLGSGGTADVTFTTPLTVPLSGVMFAIAGNPPAPVVPNPEFPVIRTEAGFGFTPGDPSQAPPAWTDISQRVIGKEGEPFISVSMGREYELSTPEAGELHIKVDNHDSAFDPTNENSPFWPDVVLGTPVRVTAFWQGRWYPVAYGYVERWPQAWPDLPQWGVSELVATDAVAVMSSAKMQSALDSDILLDAPYVLVQGAEQYTTFVNGINPTFAVTDAQGLLAANTSRVNQRSAMYVDGLAASIATGQTTNLLGDADTGFGTSAISNVPGVVTCGPGAVYTDPNLPSPLSANGVTAEFWLIIPATVPSTLLQPVVFSAYGPPSSYGPGTPSLQVLVNNHVGGSTLTVTLNDGSTLTAPFAASPSAQQVVITLTTTAVSIYINGGLQTTQSLTAAQTSAWTAITWGCPNYAYGARAISAGNYTAFDGAIYPYQLPVQRILSHWVTGSTGQSGVDATTRVAQILSWANLGIARGGQVLFAGVTDGVTQGPAYNLEGSSAADAVNQVVTNHNGALTAATPTGAVVYYHKAALFNLPPSATFGDSVDPGDGQVPYLQATSFGYDNTFLYNQTQVTQQFGANNTITVTANDFASIAAYFLRSALTQTIQTTSDLDVANAAAWLLATYSDPQLRVSAVEVDAASNPSVAFPVVLPLQQGQVVTVTRTPLGGVQITGQVLVEKIQHDIGQVIWRTSLQLSPYGLPANVLQLDEPGYDVAGSNTLS